MNHLLKYYYYSDSLSMYWLFCFALSFIVIFIICVFYVYYLHSTCFPSSTLCPSEYINFFLLLQQTQHNSIQRSDRRTLHSNKRVVENRNHHCTPLRYITSESCKLESEVRSLLRKKNSFKLLHISAAKIKSLRTTFISC